MSTVVWTGTLDRARGVSSRFIAMFEDDPEHPRFNVPSPLEWFFGPRPVPSAFAHAPFPWSKLELCGWQGEYLHDHGELPPIPAVYAIAHEVDTGRTLYVGQSRNLRSRIRKDRHRKIQTLIDLYENNPAGYHNQADPSLEIRVFYKPVEPPHAALTLSQALLWYEAIAIGLLCPLAQGNTVALEARSIMLGRDFF